jgi:hypothetical protein
MTKPRWLYWITPVRQGGMPVTFTMADGEQQRYRWRGIYGVTFGSWFIGGIRAHGERE